MSGLNRSAQRFLQDYASQYAGAKGAANLARDIVEKSVRDTGAFVHVIAARAKTPESLRGKLRRKRYRRPNQQLTDIIGVRVIAYYRDAVDPIVSRLQQEFEINTKASTDKRLALGLQDFGYRSVHLIARLRPAQVLTPDHDVLRERWFEIQIRSILEHAWAEIEHEIVYKSGVRYPDPVKRRFAALAGSLELLDNEFLALRKERDTLIDEHRQTYERNEQQRKPFDVARLLGFLEACRPSGLSWRDAASSGMPFAAGLDMSCVEALKTVGLSTPASLRLLLRSPRFRRAISSYAASKGIAPAQASHLAIVVLAVAIKNARMVQRHFPEIIYDPAIALMFQRRAQV